MSLPHFYLDTQVIAEESADTFELLLSADDAKHLRVLRMAAGEHLAVVDAAHDYFECVIVSHDKSGVVVRISQHLDAPRRPQVVLLQGIAKGDKMDTVIRHATELGVAGFVPLACERSVVKLDAKKAKARMARWATISKSAAMQSGRGSIPTIAEPCSIQDAAAMLSAFDSVLVCWEEADGSSSIAQALGSALEGFAGAMEDTRIAVVIGPEGGLSQAEVDALLASNDRAFAVTLGPSILRTETAGIVAPALVLYELEEHGCA